MPHFYTFQHEGSSWDADVEEIMQDLIGTHNIEEDTIQVAKPTLLDELTRTEQALRDKIDKELEPLLHACMQWELWIIHSANVHYLKRGDATTDYHQSTLPLPLLKQEVIHSKKQFL